ncbi:MAG: hypothetical protein ACREMH_02505 [Gemmatimonadales bacterium]
MRVFLPSRFLAAANLALALQLGACDDDDDPAGPDDGSTLSAAEAATLATVVSSSGAIDAETAPVVELLLGEVRDHGTITFAGASAAAAGPTRLTMARVEGDYDAIAFQALVQFSGGGDPEPPTMATGVVGWRGIDTGAGTVEEYFLVIAVELGVSEFPTSGNEVIAASDGAEAYYYVDATTSSYSGTSGTLAWAGASFGGGSTDCSTTVGPVTINCSYLEGSMAGSLGFMAALVEGSGAPTATFADAAFDLPALRFTVSDEPAPAAIR